MKMGNPIEQIDAPRIRATFETLEANMAEWPAPKHFLDALNSKHPRPQREALDEPQMDEQTRERNKARIAEILSRIG